MSAPLRLAAATLLAASLATVARAGDLSFVVRGAGGAAVANAVVSVYPANGPHAPVPPKDPLVVSQKDIAFSPFVLVAPVGATVSFPNQDTVRHHVYSFSPAHRFELKLYGREEHRSERFDKVGTVALGCNIHDRMAAYIDVVDTRFAALTDAQGRVRIAGLPPGPATVKVWHPFAKGPGGTLTKAVTIGPDGAADGVQLDLRPAPPGKQDH